MKGCLFCRIVRREVPADIVWESDTVAAFKDISPQAPTHMLIIPKAHVASVMELGEKDLPVMAEIHRAAQAVAKAQGVASTGFRLVVNNGHNAGQAVDHLHVHLMGGRRFSWPPG